MMKRCSCCGYLTIDDTDEIIMEICDVCFWQYDEIAQKRPDDIMGANKVSLNKARENFGLFGASEKRFINSVRQPLKEEL